VWDIPGAGDSNIQGYATDISVNLGSRVSFKVDTNSSNYRLDIYRMGYYGGLGARKLTTVESSAALPQGQPGCNSDASTGLVDCGNWALSAHWDVPADAVSGIYFAHLVREDGTSGESHVVFVVRDDNGRSDLLFQTSDTTWQAYNTYGGRSLYPTDTPRAHKVSYNRPFSTRGNAPEDWVFNAEYPMVRWLERNGYDVSYSTGVDSDRLGAELREHRAFLSVGHDEYWSATQRANVEAARDAGVHLAFFSGNEVFWKTRWENNHRTLVSYKETHANENIDQLDVWTGTWRDPRFSPPGDGGRPENALTGQLFTVNDGATTAIQVPAAEGKLRFWRHTSIAGLAPGQTATLPDKTLGYEWDEDIDNGHRPAGSFRLSSTTVTNNSMLLDYGSTFGPGIATHRMTLYRAPSGARVFGAGTVQWSWGLDAVHDSKFGPVNEAADVRMQQATANLFADMGVQAATLETGLTRPSCGNDTAPPSSRITSVGGTISGTAIDVGGRVGGVEVSTNGGARWHPADGRETWSYAGSPPTGQVLSRAVDDSGNLEGTGRAWGPCGGASTGGGSSSGGSGTSGGGKRSGPRARVTSRRVRVSRDGLLKLKIKCTSRAATCKVAVRLRRNQRTIASRRVVIRSGRPRTVQLYLSRAVRRKLARKGALRVTAVALVRDGAGRRTVTRKVIRLEASRGR
jgi:hypothetical protein